MANVTVLCPPPRTFKLTVKNTVEPTEPESFTVGIENNQTLLQALQCFAQSNSDFSFKTNEVAGIGTYLVEVMGNKKKANQFWDTFLFNETTSDVIPITLTYTVCPNDNVFLWLGFF